MQLLRRNGANPAQNVLPPSCTFDENEIWQHITQHAHAHCCGLPGKPGADDDLVAGLFLLYENHEITIMCEAQLRLAVAMLVAYGRSCARTNLAVSDV